jgi:glyoxylase-like metal-dependent hydrolase (beta-lactamase superfamily II)
MKIANLTHNSNLYTANVFLALGTWNSIEDVNTLIDVGSDVNIIRKIECINTGLGKNKIDQVILTHSHSDHATILQEIKLAYNPKVYAFNSHLKHVDHVLHDSEILKIGDQQFEVFHLTYHSYDSICLYNEKEGILFTGDTSFPLSNSNSTLFAENEKTIARLKKKKINAIYPGHGPMLCFYDRNFEVLKNEKILSE